MPTTWLHHRPVQRRYGYSRNSIDRLVKQQKLPPPSYPTGFAPMWESELLDLWDGADERERKIILDAWPRWRDALAQIERERADAASAPEPRRKRRKQTKRQHRKVVSELREGA
jgi:hypothetical protein